MARKFFNQKIKKKKVDSKLIYFIIAGSIILLLIITLLTLYIINNSKLKKATIKLRDNIAVEINNDYPDKTLFFSELENVKEKDIKINYKKVSLDKVGKYNVVIKIYGKKFKTTLNVIDTESPILKVKDFNIEVGDSYSPNDFVESCTDNNGKDCIIEFYTLSLTQDGKNYDFSNFTKEGTYSVQIIAKDESGNETPPSTATLSIGKKTTKPENCKYGTAEYDTNKYNLAVNVSDNGCALDLNLYQSEAIVAPVKSLLTSEEEKIKKEFSKIKINTDTIYFNSNISPVLNISGKGIVGYTLFIEVSILNQDNQKEIIESYYLNHLGKRDFIINKYLK